MLDIDQEMEFVAKPFDPLDDVAVGIGVFLAAAGRQRQAIGIEHDLVPLPMEFEDSLKRLVTVPSGDESEGSRVKLGFEDRRQEESYDFLGDAIGNRRDAQRPPPTIRFRNINTPHRRRKVTP